MNGTAAKPAETPPLRLVFWELTARCNLRCRHCRAEAQEDAAAGELTTAEALDAARNIRADADPIVVLTGGEPLTRTDFFDIARACTGLFSRVALATNGTLVDDGLAHEIVSAGIQRVGISLDGASPEIHDAFRGLPGAFDAAMRGIQALRRVGASVQVNMTVTRYNRDDLPRLLDLALELRLDAFHVFMLVPVGCGAEISDEARLTPEDFEHALVWLAEKTFDLRGRIQIKATCAPQYYRIMREVARRRQLDLPGAGSAGHGMHAFTRGCLAGSGVCFLSRTGDVQPCGYLPIVVGNVRRRRLGEIWRESEVFAALRDPRRLEGKCGACGYRVLCQGCRARAYAVTGNYLAEEPDCPYVPDGYGGPGGRPCRGTAR
ncbi:MAG: radical SAM protein [Lentisphaeria bacterium]|nr:radical SAM protein [Lentisphaeria bacterium]